MTMVRKTTSSNSGSGLEYVMSDATPDRFGDVIDPSGWDLRNFSRNPICLWNHNADAPIGQWENLQVRDNALRGHLKMAPAGTSPKIDELRALISAGVLRAVSVGFMPIETRPRSNSNRGELYVRQELVECSLVSTPANPNAIQVAKSLRISARTMQEVFGEQALPQRLRGLRRAIRHAKAVLAEMDTESRRKVFARAIAHLDEQERELCAKLQGTISKTAEEQRREQTRLIRAKAMATLARVDARIAAWEAQSPAAQARRYQREGVEAFTDIHLRLGLDYARSKPQQETPVLANDGTPTWRGQKLPGMTWRGQRLPAPTWRGKKI